MLLIADQVSLKCDGAWTLRSASLHVKSGHIVRVLSDCSGLGSTLLQCIAGLQPPNGGQIRWAGSIDLVARQDGVADQPDLLKMRPSEISRLGISYAPREPAIVESLTVLENLRLGAHLRTLKPAIESDLEEMLTNFPILHANSSLCASALNRDGRQMLSLGRAMMMRPRLLLLDEPTRSLSASAARQVVDVLTQMNQEGTTLLVTATSQLAEPALIPHETYHLHDGRLQLDSPRTLQTIS